MFNRNGLLGMLFAAMTACSAPNNLPLDQAQQAPVLRLTGRFLHEGDAQVFTWSGSELAFRFTGTVAKAVLKSDDRVRFNVDVDGQAHTLWVEKGEKEYVLASDLASGTHQIALMRETEAFTIETALIGEVKTDGELLVAPSTNARKLLVFGDSITAGYGVEGQSKDCSYSHATSTARKAYAILAANQLSADVHVIAWSGIGVWRSYGEQTPHNPTMRTRFNRTLANRAEMQWQAKDYSPDAIIVNLGTNDFWTGSSEGYANAMTDFITTLTARYAKVPIYLMASPMLYGEARAEQVRILKSLAIEPVRFFDAGGIEPSDGLGCDYHPNQVTQARLAQSLVLRLEADLSW